MFYRFLLHGVISLPDATSGDKYVVIFTGSFNADDDSGYLRDLLATSASHSSLLRIQN